MRTVTATRYVTPLREGGSLPAIVEADDAGLYVLKFRGAGQGTKALVAELHRRRARPRRRPARARAGAGRGRRGARPQRARRRDPRSPQGAARASTSALDYLPGCVTFDPVAGPAPAADEASAVVWFDAFVTNVDRTRAEPEPPRRGTGGSGSSTTARRSTSTTTGSASATRAAQPPFAAIHDHVLLPWASALEDAGARARARGSTRECSRRVLTQMPDGWLAGEPRLADARRPARRATSSS